VLVVKPDGTKLFIAWYDRREDPNDSLINVYGRWGTISASGDVNFEPEFRITTTSFPPVFAGTLPANMTMGHYDPVYPPEFVNLHWRYTEWSENPLIVTSSAYIGHVGEYQGAWAEADHVYMTWTDNRLLSIGTEYARNQSDIRLVRLSWPQ